MKIIAITPNKKFDAIVPIVIEGLYDLGHTVIATDRGNSVRKVYTDNQVIEHSKDADYIFVFWGKIRGNPSPKYHLLEKINRPEKTVYIDGSEWTSTGYPENIGNVKTVMSPSGMINRQVYEAKYDSSRCKGEPWINQKMFDYAEWYFKRECYKEDSDIGIIPFNVGCHKQFFGNFENIKKKYDIFCSFGHLCNGLRYEVFNFCNSLKSMGYNVLIANNLDFETYKRKISESYIGLSAWGAGNSCMRMWEIMANRTCCFAQKTEILFPNKPSDGVHYVEYSNMREFEEKIFYYLDRKTKCIEIGNSGYDFVKDYHTGAPRVEYILEKIGAHKNEKR